MTSDRVCEWEREADCIAGQMSRRSGYRWHARVRDRTNVKPWYSPRSAFRRKGGVVLIGANPAGCPQCPQDDSIIDDYKANLNCADYNAYLKESWNEKDPGCDVLQKRVRKAYRKLYPGFDSDELLRETACFNVCPLRTPEVRKIPKPIWRASVRWCKRVIDHLEPRLVICVGSAKTGNSPWAAMKSGYNLSEVQCVPVQANASIRWGRANCGVLKGRTVLALPHLSWFGGAMLFDTLGARRAEILGLAA